MLHLPHRFYHRNYIINRISPFIHNLKNYLAIFSRINHMTAIIIYKTDLAQLQLRNRLLHRLLLIFLHTDFPHFRNIRIFLYLLLSRRRQRVSNSRTGNGSHNIPNSRTTVTAPPAMIIISDKSAYRTSQTTSDRSTCHDSSRISHTPRRTSTQNQSGKQNYC